MRHRGRTLVIAFVLAAAPAWSAGRCQQPDGREAEPVAPSDPGRHVLVTFPQRSLPRLQRAGSTPRAYGGRATYKASARVQRIAAKLGKAHGLERVDEWPIEALGVHCVVYELAAGQSLTEVLERLAEDARVESAQPMQTFEVLTSGYDDPYLELQHGVRSMQLEQAHLWARGRGVKVAVVDTGVDVNHPELEDRVAMAEDFVDQGRRIFTSDIHGTAVAGVIAAAAGNSIGIVGVAPSVEILALKACWQEEERSAPALCNSFTLAKAISFAIARRADVLNLSLAGPADPLLSRLLAKAIDDGIVVVGAADPRIGARAGFPSAVAHVITVWTAETGDEGLPEREAAFRGLKAPGREILSTAPYGGYDFFSGNSLAAAHVSGLAALLLERRKKLSADEIAALLSDTTGVGVNACAALSRLLRSGSCEVGESVPRSGRAGSVTRRSEG